MAGACGIPGGKDKIVGGNEATPHSYPWMAALFVDDAWFCGATLISDEWVLTAAHCAHDASHMRVMLGAHNVQQASEEGRWAVYMNINKTLNKLSSAGDRLWIDYKVLKYFLRGGLPHLN